MICKEENRSQSEEESKVNRRRDRFGRWSRAEKELFQMLLERYGVNWRKIHQHMKYRSLGQIRSHAQKYFEKIDAPAVENFRNKAKLIEAIQIIQRQTHIKKEMESQKQVQKIHTQNNNIKQMVKIEQNQQISSEELSTIVQSGNNNLDQKIKKEQLIKLQSQPFQLSKINRPQIQLYHPHPEQIRYFNNMLINNYILSYPPYGINYVV